MSEAMIKEPSDLDILAAEYALGVLDGTDRGRAAILVAHDESFAQQVDIWNQRFAPLSESIAAEPIPWAVWHRIQATLRAEQAAQPSPARTAHAPTARPNAWRWLALGTSAIAASLAAFVAIAPVTITPRQEDRYVAILNRDATEPGWLVTLDIAAKTLTINPLIDMSPGDKAMELWLIAGNDNPPQSLGLIQPNDARALSLPIGWQAPGLGKTLLAVSLEPVGGSPTGLPTGPVIFQGNVLPLQ